MKEKDRITSVRNDYTKKQLYKVKEFKRIVMDNKIQETREHIKKLRSLYNTKGCSSKNCIQLFNLCDEFLDIIIKMMNSPWYIDFIKFINNLTDFIGALSDGLKSKLSKSFDVIKRSMNTSLDLIKIKVPKLKVITKIY